MPTSKPSTIRGAWSELRARKKREGTRAIPPCAAAKVSKAPHDHVRPTASDGFHTGEFWVAISTILIKFHSFSSVSHRRTSKEVNKLGQSKKRRTLKATSRRCHNCEHGIQFGLEKVKTRNAGNKTWQVEPGVMSRLFLTLFFFPQVLQDQEGKPRHFSRSAPNENHARQ